MILKENFSTAVIVVGYFTNDNTEKVTNQSQF